MCVCVCLCNMYILGWEGRGGGVWGGSWGVDVEIKGELFFKR